MVGSKKNFAKIEDEKYFSSQIKALVEKYANIKEDFAEKTVVFG